ncbi:MAG: hypothetical protein ACK56I_29205, partial [bacterium]
MPGDPPAGAHPARQTRPKPLAPAGRRLRGRTGRSSHGRGMARPSPEARSHCGRIGGQRRLARRGIGPSQRRRQRTRRKHARLDGRADALPALRIGEARRIPDEQHALGGQPPGCLWIEQVGVPVQAGGKSRGHSMLAPQPLAERRHMRGQALPVVPPEPDVE